MPSQTKGKCLVSIGVTLCARLTSSKIITLNPGRDLDSVFSIRPTLDDFSKRYRAFVKVLGCFDEFIPARYSI